MSDSEFQHAVKENFIKCFSISSRTEQEQFLRQLAEESGELASAVRDLLGFLETKVAEEPISDAAQDLQVTDQQIAETELIEPESLGRYKLLEKIGEGGMGTVYKAEQTTPIRRSVAIKIIKSGLDTQQVVRRFAMERQTLAMMDHSNIAKVLDAGATETGRPYFVMELVDGIPLTKFCQDQRSSIDERLRLFVEVCHGVKHAHQKGVIHRDLKPSNVLVAVQDGQPTIKIIDFGIAKTLDNYVDGATELTSHLQLVGTPLYMSPEQAEQGRPDVDTRSDVYSLGVILYELLTDTTPFSRDSLRAAGYEEIRRIIREVDPEKPSQRLTTHSGSASTLGGKQEADVRKIKLKLESELDWIVMKAIEKDRGRRYSSAGEFADDIACYLADRPVLACPPSLYYRCSKFYRKNRVTVIGAVAILACFLIGFTSTAIQWIRAENLAESEAEQRQKAERLAETETQARELADSRLYASQIRRASTEWEYGDHIIAQRSLAETDSLHRSWEYDLLNRLFSADSLAAAEGHEGAILTLVFSNDGSQIVTGGADGTIRYWDSTTLEQQFLVDAHTAPINEIVLSPDGKTIISGSADRAIKFWDFDTRAIKSEQEHTSEVHAVAVSPNSKFVAFGGNDGTIQVWNQETQEDQVLFEPKAGRILTLAFSPESDCLASGTDRNALDFWAVNGPPSSLATAFDFVQRALGSPKSLIFRFDGHSAQVTGVKFSPYQFPDVGPIALTAGDDGVIRGWDYQDGIQFLYYTGHVKPVRDLQICPNGIHFASAGSDGTVRLWRHDEGLELTQFREHSSEVNCVGFSPDGKLLASGGADGQLFLWSTDQRPLRGSWNVQEEDAVDDPEGGISESAFSPNGKMAFTVGFSKLVVWDSISKETLAKVDLRSGVVANTTWTLNGEDIAVCYEDGMLDFIDAPSGEIRKTYDTGLKLDTYVHHSSREGLLISGSKVVLWDFEAGRASQEWLANERVTAVCWKDDFLAYTTTTGRVSLSTISNQAEVANLRAEPSTRSWIGISEDLETLVSVTKESTLKIWDIQTGELTKAVDLGEPNLSAVRIDSESRRLLTGNEQGTVRIWDLHSGAYLMSLPAFEGFDERVTAVDVAKDNTRLLYSSDSIEVYTWDMSDLSQANNQQ